MITLRRAALACVALFAAACTPPTTSSTATSTATTSVTADDPAVAVVRSVYAPYLHDGSTANLDQAPLTPGLHTLLAQAESHADGEFLDADPIIQAQDYSPLTDLAITLDAPAANGHATITASFKNMGEATTVHYDMIETAGAWQIDNIRSGQSNLRETLDHAH